jgi:hypothetical protein
LNLEPRFQKLALSIVLRTVHEAQELPKLFLSFLLEGWVPLLSSTQSLGPAPSRKHCMHMRPGRFSRMRTHTLTSTRCAVATGVMMFLMVSTVAVAEDGPVQAHGSGATNPEKLFWKVQVSVCVCVWVGGCARARACVWVGVGVWVCCC